MDAKTFPMGWDSVEIYMGMNSYNSPTLKGAHWIHPWIDGMLELAETQYTRRELHAVRIHWRVLVVGWLVIAWTDTAWTDQTNSTDRR